MLEDGLDKIFGGNNLIYVYLCKKNPKINNLMMPADQEIAIKGMLGWYQARLLVPCR